MNVSGGIFCQKRRVGTGVTYHDLICVPETPYMAPISSQVAQSHELMVLVQPCSACGGTQTMSGVPAQISSQVTKELSCLTSPDTSANLDSILSL